MSASSELTVVSRDKIGKANRRLAVDKQIPAVLYGPGREPMPIAIDRHGFELFMAHHTAGATVVDLKLEGEKKTIPAMVRDVQHSAVKGSVLHVDFMVVEMGKSIHAVTPLHLVNDPEGVKAGGVLTVSLHEVNIDAKPGDLPESIDVDVAGLQMGDSLHVSDIVAPKGVTILDDPETVVASVQAPRAEVESELPEEGAQPELIGGSSEE